MILNQKFYLPYHFFCSLKKAYANACNGGTTTSTTTSATTASTTTTKSTTTTTASTTTGSGSGSSGCVQWWIGDGFCDPENNKKACRFDGGDCCAPYAHPHWDWSCKWTNVRFVTIQYVIFRLVILVFFSNVSARNEATTTITTCSDPKRLTHFAIYFLLCTIFQ